MIISALNEILTSAAFDKLIDKAVIENAWFTRQTIENAVAAIRCEMLDGDKVDEWLSRYTMPREPKIVGIVMAGNIPLVGFFDLLCVLVTGHKARVKPSSKDMVMMKHIVEELAVRGFDVSCVTQIETVDMLIATGGAEAAAHYTANFSEIPTLIRSDRHSIAMLRGDETEEQLRLLTEDMFMYWGLGCRNVNHIYLPVGYDLSKLPCYVSHFKPFEDSYRYHKALYTMIGGEFTDKKGYLLMPADGQTPPIAVVHYSYYDDENSIEIDKNRIQCIVSSRGCVDFGQSQHPALTDYADDKDVIRFLTNS